MQIINIPIIRSKESEFWGAVEISVPSEEYEFIVMGIPIKDIDVVQGFLRKIRKM